MLKYRPQWCSKGTEGLQAGRLCRPGEGRLFPQGPSYALGHTPEGCWGRGQAVGLLWLSSSCSYFSPYTVMGVWPQLKTQSRQQRALCEHGGSYSRGKQCFTPSRQKPILSWHFTSRMGPVQSNSRRNSCVHEKLSRQFENAAKLILCCLKYFST